VEILLTNTITKNTQQRFQQNNKMEKMEKIVMIWLCMTSLANAQDSIVIQGNLHNNSHFAKVIVNKFGVGSFAIAAALSNPGCTVFNTVKLRAIM